MTTTTRKPKISRLSPLSVTLTDCQAARFDKSVLVQHPGDETLFAADDIIADHVDVWSRIDASGDCWVWVGARAGTGYGQYCPQKGITIMAHRHIWELLVGPIPEGLVLDHLCRNRPCVNPDHCRIVTMTENTLAGYGAAAQNARKTHCKLGHPLSGDNLYRTKSGRRRCAECSRNDNRTRKIARRAG